MSDSRMAHMPKDKVMIGGKEVKAKKFIRSKKLDEEKGENLKKEMSEQEREVKKASPHEKGKKGEVKAKRKAKRTIKMSQKELVEEHKELVNTLKSGSKSKLAKEAKKQGKELKEYKSTGPHYGQKAVGGEKIAKYRGKAKRAVAHGEVKSQHPSKSNRKLGLSNVNVGSPSKRVAYRKLASNINAKGIPMVPQHKNMMKSMLDEYNKQRRGR